MNPKDLKILFMGTPEIAATILSGLLEHGYRVSSVITRPDKPKGRSKEPVQSPVKVLAEKKDIPVFQPNTKIELQEYVEKEKPDLAIVCAFGMIITPETIEVPKYKTINVHPSLLPKYRGPWPIGAPILAGDQKTGTTIMMVSEKMDEGDILAQEEHALNGTETTPELTATLANLSKELLLKTIPEIVAGTITPKPQDHNLATYTHFEKKEDGKIDWENQAATEIERMSRALLPWPGIYTLFEEKKMDLYDISVEADELEPGVVAEKDGKIIIGTKEGAIFPGSVKLEGKTRIPTADFIKGYRSFIGSKLGK